jgi:hypothetical protein
VSVGSHRLSTLRNRTVALDKIGCGRIAPQANSADTKPVRSGNSNETAAFRATVKRGKKEFFVVVQIFMDAA